MRLRDRRLMGFKFRRQYGIGRYIADFCCPEKRLIIELDGECHNNRIEYDQVRTQFLEQKGYLVLRFRNEEVMNNLNLVCIRISELCSRGCALSTSVERVAPGNEVKGAG